METVAITSQAPVMPTAWPQSEHIRPVKRRLPNTVDEPKNIGYYLECYLCITIKFFNYVFSINLSDDYSRYGSEYQYP